MHDIKKYAAAVVDCLKQWAKAAALGNSLLVVALVYPWAAGSASAAACPASQPFNLPAYIALGAGSCTLPDGSTLSNFRYNTSTTGGATVPPASNGTLTFAGAANMNEGSTWTAPGSGNSLTLNFGYNLTAAPGTVLNGVGQGISFFSGGLVSPSSTLTANHSFCIGGTFSSIPPGSCSGTLYTPPPQVTTFQVGVSLVTPFAPASSVDVYASMTATGTVIAGNVTQFFTTAAVAPPPPATPAPPSIILALIGLACAGLYMARRRFARQT